jgi:antitoxin component YwqK of YwqJK toxin-antitoxin module
MALVLCIMISGSASAWWEIKYDTTETFWPSGNLKERWTSSWDTGNERGFINNGQYSSWYPNGQLHQQGDYLNGNKHFTWTEWYEDGQRSEETSYRHGEKYGRNVAWHPNHDIKYIAHYKYEALHGLYISRKMPYDPNNPDLFIIDKKFYQHGQLIMIYYDNGQWRHSAGPYYNEDVNLWIETVKDYSRISVGNKIGDNKNGRWITWSAEGEMKKVEFYENGELLEIE